MKKTIEIIIVSVIAFFSMTLCAFAENHCGYDRDTHDRMKAERVAFLTAEMDLTPSEAEKFWPVYNDMEKERRMSFHKVISSYGALDEGIKNGKSEKEISALLDAYVEAMKASRGIEAKYVPVFSKIVPVEKVAKMFIGEEKFRRMQINKWNDKKD